MRCAFCNIEAVGHTVPTLTVARLWRDEGHQVRYLTQTSDGAGHRLIAESGLHVEYLPGEGADTRAAATQTIRELAEVLRSGQIDLLFSGSLYYKGAIAAEVVGVPEVRLFPNPFVRTEYAECPFADFRGSAQPDTGQAAWLANVNAIRESFDLPVLPSLRLLRSPFANILMVDPTIPHLRAPDPEVFVSGPIVEDRVGRERRPRASGERVRLFISIGTEVSKSERGQAFLTRILRELDRDETDGPLVRLYVGTEPLQGGAVPRTGSVTVLSGLVDQQREIADADLVVSHGGWNTVHEAILLGRPQIVLPFEGHQHDTGYWVREQNLGRWMTPEDFGYPTSAERIHALLHAEACLAQVGERSQRLASRRNRDELLRYVLDRYAALAPAVPGEAPPAAAAAGGLPRVVAGRAPAPVSAPAAATHMRITCGVASLEALELVARSGADEVFCGLQDPDERSAFFRILNRREMRDANLTSAAALDAFLARAQELGLRVSVALNELFTAPQYPRVRKVLDLLATRPIDGLIVSDFGLLLLLHHEYRDRFAVHMGTGALALNRGTVALYRAHGARRIILSRKLFTHEIAALAKAFPDLELEAFMELDAFCPNFDGLCNMLHNNLACPGDRCAVIERRFPVAREHRLVNHGCKLCALWDYVRLKITCLKIPHRDRNPRDSVTLIGLLRELEAQAASTTKAEFVARARAGYTEVFGRACPTPTGCFLAQSF